jgi:hypothetical protein
MIFAFARLAAMAAATLDFFETFGVEGKATGKSEEGHAFSNCLRALESNAFKTTMPRSFQMLANTQNSARATSLTPGLGSANDFFTAFSMVSRLPEASMACLERCP